MKEAPFIVYVLWRFREGRAKAATMDTPLIMYYALEGRHAGHAKATVKEVHLILHHAPAERGEGEAKAVMEGAAHIMYCAFLPGAIEDQYQWENGEKDKASMAIGGVC